MEPRRRFAEQYGDGMFGLGAQQVCFSRPCAGGFELGFRLIHFGPGCEAAIMKPLSQRKRPRVVGHGSIQDFLLCISTPENEVIARKIRVDCER